VSSTRLPFRHLPGGLLMLQGAIFLKLTMAKPFPRLLGISLWRTAVDKGFPAVARPADFLRVSRGTVIHTFLFLPFHYFNAPRNTSLH
jgi:hypothetical protein